MDEIEVLNEDIKIIKKYLKYDQKIKGLAKK